MTAPSGDFNRMGIGRSRDSRDMGATKLDRSRLFQQLADARETGSHDPDNRAKGESSPMRH